MDIMEPDPPQQNVSPVPTNPEQQTIQPPALPDEPEQVEAEPINETQEAEDSELITSGYDIQTPEPDIQEVPVITDF